MIPIIFLVLIILLSTCHTNDKVNSGNFYVVNFDQAVSREIKLDAIVDSVEFTFLQYDEQNPVGEILNYKITENYLWVVDSEQKLFVFKSNGDLVSIVSRQGKGPEEYITIEDFAIDSKEEHIVVLSPHNEKIIKYNIMGEYVAGYSIEYNHATHVSNFNNNNYLIYQSARFSESDINIFILDEHFQTIGSVVDPEGTSIKTLPYLLDVHWYQHDNNIYYKEVFVDTVFTINESHMSEPHISFDLGNKRMPNHYYSKTGLYQKNAHKYFLLGDIKESENYIFIQILINNENRYFVYHKNIEQQLLDFGAEVLPKHSDLPTFFWPEYIHNETMYRFIGATELYNRLGPSLAEHSIKGILETNDNPVLLSGKLLSKLNRKSMNVDSAWSPLSCLN